MLLPGAEALGLTHSQCLELLESADDPLDFVSSSLTYLIHAESQQVRRHPPHITVIRFFAAMAHAPFTAV